MDRLQADLESAGLGDWATSLVPLLAGRLAPGAHGDLPRWQAALAALPAVGDRGCRLDADTVVVRDQPLPDADRDTATAALKALSPWRKGPFDVGGILVDSEWRSDLKWRRLATAVAPLEGRRVLDVGCGNGYYALRMLGAGARLVVGVDPTLLFVMQFRALAHFLPPLPVHVLPLRSQELPAASGAFDTVFSMGVLYHQRAPVDHLRELRAQLAPGGELVLETIVLPGDEALSRTPADRYARMRNVWHLPTVPELETWLARSGYRDVRVHDVTVTTPEEQRPTDWMTFESLAQALDPADPTRTIEGWPAPHRALLTARR